MNQPLFEISGFSTDQLASLPANQNDEIFKFERHDWTLFRSLSTLPQKAGVPANRLRRLVLKELADNALDAGALVSVKEDGDLYTVQDNGPGFDGSPQDIADLFSIARPMASTKLWRMPQRGALGNGLRVAAGSVLASGGTLAVITRGRRIDLAPKDDGTTSWTTTDVATEAGARIEISFGANMAADDEALSWAGLAVAMSGGEIYSGKSSPYWYDADHFFELVNAAGSRPVRSLVDRCLQMYICADRLSS